jgi:serine/threonine protein kinase
MMDHDPGLTSATDFQDRLDAFVAGLTHDACGNPRHGDEQAALIDAARSLLDRLASGEPALPPEQAAPSDAAGSLAGGQVLANTYTVLELIGRGGVSDVFRVRHRELRSERAIKILGLEHAHDPLLKEMMVDEARALLNLACPGVVRGHELMRHGDGRLLIVMNFVRGLTLAERIAAGRLPLDEIFALARRLATTLAAVHAAGYVHQDISPENIVLPDGNARAAVLIDFGIAIDLRRPAVRRRPLDFAGKLSFASPEQLLGAATTEASDLYSLGLVIAAAARGCKLDIGRDDMSARAARTIVPPLSDVPAELGPTLQKLLQPDPRARPTARWLAAQLAAQAADDPVTAKPAQDANASRYRFFRRSLSFSRVTSSPPFCSAHGFSFPPVDGAESG